MKIFQKKFIWRIYLLLLVLEKFLKFKDDKDGLAFALTENIGDQKKITNQIKLMI